MGNDAATVDSDHLCPLSDGPKPHRGGKVSGPGVPRVLIGGKAAATVGSVCPCDSPAPNAVRTGSARVMIGGLPAAFKGSRTAHGGTVTTGVPRVVIGG